MRTAMLFGISALVFCGICRGQESIVSPEAGFVGKYDIIAGEDNGKPAPEDRIKDATVTITNDTIVVRDKDNNETYATKYTLNATKKPYRIDMVETAGPKGRKGAKAIGIIENDGETVRLAYCYEGGILPTEFKTKAGDKQLMFVMKRKPSSK